MHLFDIKFSTIVFETLAEIAPEQSPIFEKNLSLFLEDLQELDGELRETFQSLRSRCFMVFHPSWGYFADAYGLEQIPIEIEGKSPTAKQLTELIQVAKEKRIRVIFIQPQFSRKMAEMVAREIEAEVVAIDPLAKDYLVNLRKVAKLLREAP